ncbi:hypothetical protein [uncultured Ruminococcus sp.]|uniref:hypothetical protein n=1 Tax=uncultured Ruminococcus sp. TaxID=165186 RepID=UPI0025D348E8|nr:hypothetical protein [uncultured Ruminococcus sp.]
MVTDKEIKNRKFKCEFKKEKLSYQVSSQEMRIFSENKRKLAKTLNNFVLKLEMDYDCSRNKIADKIEENCQQSWDTYKRIINGRCKATRVALYKFCIGMNLSRKEADTLFNLTEEGRLTDDNIGDYIFIRALGQDSIFDFIDEFEKYTGKSIALRERRMN